MEPVTVAKTEPREHANGAEGLWWVEYRVRQLTDGERAARPEHLWLRGMMFALETRYAHERDSEYCVNAHSGEWKEWDYGRTVKDAVMSCAGDSQYGEATSLHELHREMVASVKADRERDARIAELRELTHYQTKDSFYTPLKWVELNVVADERERAEGEFERGLKAARIFKAANEGKAPQAKVDAIKAKVRAAYEQRLAERKAKHAEMMAELEQLGKAAGR